MEAPHLENIISLQAGAILGPPPQIFLPNHPSSLPTLLPSSSFPYSRVFLTGGNCFLSLLIFICLICLFIWFAFETGSHYVTRAGPELTVSQTFHPPASASWVLRLYLSIMSLSLVWTREAMSSVQRQMWKRCMLVYMYASPECWEAWAHWIPHQSEHISYPHLHFWTLLCMKQNQSTLEKWLRQGKCTTNLDPFYTRWEEEAAFQEQRDFSKWQSQLEEALADQIGDALEDVNRSWL